MRRGFLACLVVFTLLVPPGSAGGSSREVRWAGYVANNGSDSAASIDRWRGNLYIVGEIAVDSAGSSTAVVASWRIGGRRRWLRTINAGELALLDVFADGTGVYVVGMSTDSSGEQDGYIRKYSATGRVKWTRSISAPGEERDIAFAVAGRNRAIYVVGRSNGVLTSDEASDGGSFILKLSPAGRRRWIRQFPTDAWTNAREVTTDDTGVYIVGTVGPGSFPGHETQDEDDVFVRKYGFGGRALWTDQFGSSQEENGLGIAARHGRVYVTGNTFGSLEGAVNQGQYDCFIRMYSGDGDAGWTRQFGTTAGELIGSPYVYGKSIYVGGYTDGVFPGEEDGTGTDAFVAAFRPNGSTAWLDQFGTASGEVVTAITGRRRALLLTGITGGRFGRAVRKKDLDVFVAKYR